MAEYLIQDSTLEDIANAIRSKTGGSSAMTPAEMVAAIMSISGGGGGLEYEAGTLTAASDNRTKISFAKTHSVTPAIVVFGDVSDTFVSKSQSAILFVAIDFQKLFNNSKVKNASTASVGIIYYSYKGTSTTSSSAAWQTDRINTNYLTASGFTPWCGNTSRLLRAGQTYKWIAIWAS